MRTFIKSTVSSCRHTISNSEAWNIRKSQHKMALFISILLYLCGLWCWLLTFHSISWQTVILMVRLGRGASTDLWMVARGCFDIIHQFGGAFECDLASIDAQIVFVALTDMRHFEDAFGRAMHERCFGRFFIQTLCEAIETISKTTFRLNQKGCAMNLHSISHARADRKTPSSGWTIIHRCRLIQGHGLVCMQSISSNFPDAEPFERCQPRRLGKRPTCIELHFAADNSFGDDRTAILRHISVALAYRRSTCNIWCKIFDAAEIQSLCPGTVLADRQRHIRLPKWQPSKRQQVMHLRNWKRERMAIDWILWAQWEYSTKNLLVILVDDSIDACTVMKTHTENNRRIRMPQPFL